MWSFWYCGQCNRSFRRNPWQCPSLRATESHHVAVDDDDDGGGGDVADIVDVSLLVQRTTLVAD